MTTAEKLDVASEELKNHICDPKFLESLYMIINDVTETVKVKNKKYGDSALNPLEIFGGKENSTSIDVRIDDKLSRIKNSELVRKNDLFDLIGYGLLKAVQMSFNDFGDMID